MLKIKTSILPLLLSMIAASTCAQTAKFTLQPTLQALTGTVRQHATFDVSGRKAALFGRENGTFEAWIFPFQIVENFRLQYRFAEMPAPDDLSHYATSIEVLPERTSITYSHPLFTLRQHLFAPIDEQAIIMLLEVDTYRAFEIYASFFPRMQPMWPGGMGGQYATWLPERNAYLISESRRRYNALIGSPSARKQSPPLAHELSQKPILFALAIEPEQAKAQYYPIVLAADFHSREACLEKYSALLANIEQQVRQTQHDWQRFLQNTLSLSGTEFDAALAWNKVAMHKGFVCNPDLGCGMVAGFGPSGASKRPGFCWYFGGDMFINSFAMAAYGDFDILEQSFAFLQKYQRADGKMMHELSQSAGMLDWFEDFPYGYIHGDTTPFYLAALHNFTLHSGDTTFIRKSWDSIEKAYDWCRSTDSDGDGLMENTLAGLGASELGSLREATGIDIYLAAIGVQAWKAFAELARIAGRGAKMQAEAMQWHQRGKASLERRFWNADSGYYNFSITKTGAPNPELTAWVAFPMLFDLLPQAHARRALVEIASAKISTDWGSRMLSGASPAYDPLAYNNGGVWPFLTGFTTWALYKQGNAEAGVQSLRNLANWLDADARGTMPEIASGAYFRALETSVPHQLFSSFGFTAGLLRGLLGLEVDAEKRTVRIAPQLPPDWPAFQIKNITLGEDSLSIAILQNAGGVKLHVIEKPDKPITIEFRPAFGAFASLDTAHTTPGIAAKRGSDAWRVRIGTSFSTAQFDSVHIGVDDPLRIWQPYQRPRIGDPPRQMKWLACEKTAPRELVLTLEAPGGTQQFLHYRASEEIEVENATLAQNAKIAVTFAGSGFVRQQVTIRIVE